MLTKRIIPCLDVDRGRVVKGVKFFDHVDAVVIGSGTAVERRTEHAPSLRTRHAAERKRIGD